MSSDYYIKTQDLKDVGVSFEDATCSVTHEPITLIMLPGYDYKREVFVDEEEGVSNTHISCGGAFRNWFENFLNDHQIAHERF